ncbi:hypothetical protein POX_f08225 [Penicillium oxalicum]|uniref:Uncharacterized protein n=1 Tax=Penicillium oxalicum (strain 114-2 / CGMCC 5302) TaxID=933388 RepID=S7ZKG2_PENO1|nr:hypothetical protein POX_f08225 [Penicillium oxalicum]EPS29176.1 hypothetical protein PDE_04125 [Penicillium oxalicum 114-2]KAI2787847.1 hypothetical protein POX_f08225 [Penicillium oxalicum]
MHDGGRPSRRDPIGKKRFQKRLESHQVGYVVRVWSEGISPFVTDLAHVGKIEIWKRICRLMISKVSRVWSALSWAKRSLSSHSQSAPQAPADQQAAQIGLKRGNAVVQNVDVMKI